MLSSPSCEAHGPTCPMSQPSETPRPTKGCTGGRITERSLHPAQHKVFGVRAHTERLLQGVKSLGKAKTRGTPDSVPSEQEGPQSPSEPGQTRGLVRWGTEAQPLDSQSCALCATSVHRLGLQGGSQTIFSGLGAMTA